MSLRLNPLLQLLKKLYLPPVVSESELAVSVTEIAQPVPSGVAPPCPKEAQIPPPVVAITKPGGVPHLSQIEMVPSGARIPQNCFPADQPLDIRLTLDLSDVRVPGNIQFSYRASIYSKSLEGFPRRVVGEAGGIITSIDKATVSVEGIALPKDTCRLKAMMILNPITAEPTLQAGLVVSKESDLLLIF